MDSGARHGNGNLQADPSAGMALRASDKGIPKGNTGTNAKNGRRGSHYAAAPSLTQGEIADRISILELKSQHDQADTVEELIDLTRSWRGELKDLERLRRINRDGWIVVGAIHAHFDGAKLLEDRDIIDACRAAHVINRDRVAVKNEINMKFGQRTEFKTWKAD